MVKVRKLILLSFLLLFPLMANHAESANPAGETHTERRITELENQMNRLKESLQNSIQVDLLKFFTIILIGGGFVVWILLYTSLHGTLKDTLTRYLERHGDKLMEETKSDVRTTRHYGDSERENSLGAFWEELYEESPEESRNTGYLEIALDFYERALTAAGKIEEREFMRNICIYKNNLAHCLSLRTVAGVSSPDDKDRALKEIRYAVDNGNHYPGVGFRFEETYGWVLLRFSGDNEEEREKGHKLIKNVLSRGDLPRAWYERRLKVYQAFADREKR